MRGSEEYTSCGKDHEQASSEEEGYDRTSSSSDGSIDSRSLSISLNGTTADHNAQSKLILTPKINSSDKSEENNGAEGATNLDLAAEIATDYGISSAFQVSTGENEDEITRRTSEQAADSPSAKDSNSLAHGHDIFDVIFPSTGPLGITFQWDVDPTMWPAVAPQIADVSNSDTARDQESVDSNAMLLRTPRTRTEVETHKVLLREKPSTLLPALSSSPAGAISELTVLPHALRIESFPVLAEASPRLPGTSTTPTATADQAFPTRSPTFPIDASLSGQNGFSRAHALKPEAVDEPAENSEKPKLSDGFLEKNFPRETETEAKTGPVAGRNVLRPGDILVEVNGTPVAGPAALRAGIECFQDAVEVVAKASTTTQLEDGGGAARVFKFRRARQWGSFSSAQPPLAPRVIPPLRDECLGSTSTVSLKETKEGTDLRPQSITENEIASSDAALDSSRSRLHDALTIRSQGGFLEPVDHRVGTDMDGNGVLTLMSSRSISSLGSRGSFQGGAKGRRKKKGPGRSRGGQSLLSAASSPTGARIKAEAR